jgi:predicted dehydrogenase
VTGITVAVVGLNFGRLWLPIYLAHPDVRTVVICDPDPAALSAVGDQYGIERRLTSLDEVLAADDVDAVHLLTPLDLHAPQSLSVLASGKHCAVAVTAALDMASLWDIVRAQRESGKNYMMMETGGYSRAALHIKRMVDEGRFGEITFGRGAHHQDVGGLSSLWTGIPPLWYSSHALAPLLTILGTSVSSVRALGSGRLPVEKRGRWGNAFPVETAIYDLVDSPVALEITRSTHQTVSGQGEWFSVYSDRHGFDWGRAWGEEGQLFHSRDAGDGTIRSEPFHPSDTTSELPEQLRERLGPQAVDALFEPGAHLVDEFVRSIVEGRPSGIDAVVAANWTAAGIAGHESALAGGAVVAIPDFGREA